jgi:hypothetical protein
MTNTITIKFAADRVLTQQEIDNLANALYAQVQEPADEFGDDETYTTSDIEIDLEVEA